MKTIFKNKIILAVICILLCVAIVTIVCLINNNTNHTMALTRDVVLENAQIDVQAILNGFDNPFLIQENELTTFIGSQTISADDLKQFDFLSEKEIAETENSNVKYTFTYNNETNTVTLKASLYMPDGTVEIDTVEGVAFINENNEIDAVMNIDGEGILLSEMRSSGMIDNAGWLSGLIKKVATVVAVAAGAVAAVALVVATAGAAAPAVVAAGIGFSTTVVVGAATTAAAIAGYAALTAAISAGVALTAGLVEKYYPGIGAVDTYENNKKIVCVDWNAKTRTAVEEIVVANTKNKPNDPKIYFQCQANGNKPAKINLSDPLTKSEMASKMKTIGKSSLTALKINAKAVMETAFPGYGIFDEPNGPWDGTGHWHYTDKYKNGKPNPYDTRPTVNGFSVHSFYLI